MAFFWRVLSPCSECICYSSGATSEWPFTTECKNQKKGKPFIKLCLNGQIKITVAKGQINQLQLKNKSQLDATYFFITLMLNMFRTLLCPSSGSNDYSADKCPGCRQPGHLSSLPAPNLQSTTTQEPDGQCGNQHYSCELLMMGIAVPETCWA